MKSIRVNEDDINLGAIFAMIHAAAMGNGMSRQDANNVMEFFLEVKVGIGHEIGENVKWANIIVATIKDRK